MTRGNDEADRLWRLRVVIRGAVQGVGFRPFIYRLATGMKLNGWVINSSQGVFVEVEGSQAQLDAFLLRIEPEKPPHAFIQSLESSFLDPVGFTAFEIRHSDERGEKTVVVLPDLATCPDCQREIFDPANRRHGYAFTNCTNCGPRFSIIEALPYDRPNTTMQAFGMCDECRAEYENPLDRRFHAQPNACPKCGPRLELWDVKGNVAVGAHHDAPLQSAAEAMRKGQVVAVKGLGGFHLMVDARNDAAVNTLRQRKRREEKPFALMYPSLDSIRAHCEVSDIEARLLLSAESPIVLLRKRSAFGSQLSAVSPLVSPPPNPYLGVMLPYTPLHHLLMAELGFPVVATSGNLSDEPICTDEHEAVEQLRGIADAFLVHNRPIARHVDDSIVRVMVGREMVLRRARGYAPLPVRCQSTEHRTQNTEHRTQNTEHRTQNTEHRAQNTEHRIRVLAVGAHLKNAVAVAIGDNTFISQHIGDLETVQAYEAFQRVIDSLSALYAFQPDVVACDLHPDYLSTQFAETYARQRNLPLVRVQHHHAHIAACMADNGLEGRALGIAWDGTGYGTDGTIWGGEFLLVDHRAEAGVNPAPTQGVNSAPTQGVNPAPTQGVNSAPTQGVNSAPTQRIGHLRPFRLPGGDAAVKEPRRVALGVLYEILGDEAFERNDLPPVAAFTRTERSVMKQMLHHGINSPLTTSAGRLFDAVSSLAGLRQRLNYEGQAAMELEFAIDGFETQEAYPFSILHSPFSILHSPISILHSPISIDWAPLIRAVIDDARSKAPAGLIAARFHNALVGMIVTVARLAGEPRVVLSGGCFQNRYLLERTVGRLRAEGFHPYWHQRVPPNDGGIALGQIAVAGHAVNW